MYSNYVLYTRRSTVITMNSESLQIEELAKNTEFLISDIAFIIRVKEIALMNAFVKYRIAMEDGAEIPIEEDFRNEEGTSIIEALKSKDHIKMRYARKVLWERKYHEPDEQKIKGGSCCHPL